MTRVLVISWPVDSEELVNSFLGDGVGPALAFFFGSLGESVFI